VLTEEQRAEIQQEVSRILLEANRSTKRDDLERDELLKYYNPYKQFGFSQVVGEHSFDALEPLVRVIARAVEVLGSSEKALRWINAPVRSLGNQTPASLLNTPEGIKRVEDSLGRIEHGVW
jgi:hypothetical protein